MYRNFCNETVNKIINIIRNAFHRVILLYDFLLYAEDRIEKEFKYLLVVFFLHINIIIELTDRVT